MKAVLQYCTNLDFLEIRACKLMPPVEAPEVSANGLALAVKVVVEVLHSSHVPMRCSSPVNHDAFMCVCSASRWSYWREIAVHGGVALCR